MSMGKPHSQNLALGCCGGDLKAELQASVLEQVLMVHGAILKGHWAFSHH